MRHSRRRNRSAEVHHLGRARDVATDPLWRASPTADSGKLQSETQFPDGVVRLNDAWDFRIRLRSIETPQPALVPRGRGRPPARRSAPRPARRFSSRVRVFPAISSARKNSQENAAPKYVEYRVSRPSARRRRCIAADRPLERVALEIDGNPCRHGRQVFRSARRRRGERPLLRDRREPPLAAMPRCRDRQINSVLQTRLPGFCWSPADAPLPHPVSARTSARRDTDTCRGSKTPREPGRRSVMPRGKAPHHDEPRGNSAAAIAAVSRSARETR